MRMLLERIVLVFLGIVFTLSMIRTVRSLATNYTRSRELEERKSQLLRVAKKHEELENSLKTVQSTAYIEKIAREKLDLVREGEYVVMLPSEDSQATAAAELTVQSNWDEWKARFW